MSGRHDLLNRTSFRALGMLLVSQCALLNERQMCIGAEPFKVEQAGDHFVNFVIAEIETTRNALPAITRAAEAAADRIVHRNGELLSAGDQIFSLEPVWRAGGIARAKQILCSTLVQELPPKPAVYGEVGELRHATSFDELPQGEDRIYIDLKFAQYNAVLKIPGYPIPALETCAFAEDVVYWHLVADTAEILGKK